MACANAGTPHSNGSQFFITLDRCDWLDKKNTIFGKVHVYLDCPHCACLGVNVCFIGGDYSFTMYVCVRPGHWGFYLQSSGLG